MQRNTNHCDVPGWTGSGGDSGVQQSAMVTCSLETTQNKTTTTINKLSTNRQVEHGHSECARSDGTVVRGSCGGGGRVVRGGGA